MSSRPEKCGRENLRLQCGWHGRWHVWSPGILGLLCAVRTSVFNSFKSLLLLGAQVLKSGKGKVSLGAGARDPQELCFLS
jgi:hypothetical protein